MTRLQRTLAEPVTWSGVGLHSGTASSIRLVPGAADTGVIFCRVDLPERPRIPASVECVADLPRQTALRHNGAEVQTIEHLLSALVGMGVDNVLVEIDGIELPGGDGSSLEYVRLVQKAGVVEQARECRRVRVTEPVSISEGDVSLVALPARSGDGLTISYTLDYRASETVVQHLTLEVGPDSYVREIAPARTFCMRSEVEELRRRGLGKGATYQNTLVIGDQGVIENSLRFQDEFVRHKILDLLGDLYLLGAPLEGHIIAVKSGHGVNVRLVRKLREQSRRTVPTVLGREQQIDSVGIQQLLPHRYPFLLVDRIVHLEPGRHVVGIKNVTANEQFFQGHFPGRPVMPGVLQVEAMAQVAGIMLLDRDRPLRKLAFLMTIDDAKMRKAVVPGDQLVLEARTLSLRPRAGHVATTASVNGQVVAEARMKFMLLDETW